MGSLGQQRAVAILQKVKARGTALPRVRILCIAAMSYAATKVLAAADAFLSKQQWAFPILKKI